MKKIFHKAKQRPWLTALAAIAVLGAGLYFGLSGKKEIVLETVRAEQGELFQEVTVTGRVVPVSNIALAFEKSGRVVRINADVSDQVSEGQVLVELDSEEVSAQLRQAEASVSAEKAKLAELLRGARTEDVRIKETELQKARQDLANEYASVPDVLQDAYTKTDDAIRKQINSLFTSEDTTPQLTFSVSNSQKKIDAEAGRLRLSAVLISWQDELLGISVSSSQAALDSALVNAKSRLSEARSFLSIVMDTTLSASSLDADTKTAYLGYVSTARTNVNTALAAVNQQDQELSSQKLVVQRIENELALKLAGASSEEVSAQQAKVEQAQANVSVIRAQLNKSFLRSPIRGTVTEQNAKVGQIVSANQTIMTVISQSNLEVDANVPEADMAKLQLGNAVRITLDAYGDDVLFTGKVVRIDPAETVIEGVSTYKTTIQFDTDDVRIRSGMTANLDIRTDERLNAIVIPQRSVISRNGRKFVLVAAGSGTEEREIQTGLKGSDGNIEVVSGLVPGELILRSPQ